MPGNQLLIPRQNVPTIDANLVSKDVELLKTLINVVRCWKLDCFIEENVKKWKKFFFHDMVYRPPRFHSDTLGTWEKCHCKQVSL